MGLDLRSCVRCRRAMTLHADGVCQGCRSEADENRASWMSGQRHAETYGNAGGMHLGVSEILGRSFNGAKIVEGFEMMAAVEA